MSKHKEVHTFRTFKTAKGNIGIVHESFNYRKCNSLTSGEISWRCTNKTCSASLKTCGNIKTVKSKSGSHNHQPPAKEPLFLSESTSSTKLTTPKNDSIISHPSENLSDAAESPSLTDIVSPYITISPVLPKYSCKEMENEHLRQRVAELEFINEALTNKAIDLEKEIINLREIKDVKSSSVQTDPRTMKNVSTHTEEQIQSCARHEQDKPIDKTPTIVTPDLPILTPKSHPSASTSQFTQSDYWQKSTSPLGCMELPCAEITTVMNEIDSLNKKQGILESRLAVLEAISFQNKSTYETVEPPIVLVQPSEAAPEIPIPEIVQPVISSPKRFIKSPPCTAKIRLKNETYEDFFDRTFQEFLSGSDFNHKSDSGEEISLLYPSVPATGTNEDNADTAASHVETTVYVNNEENSNTSYFLESAYKNREKRKSPYADKD